MEDGDLLRIMANQWALGGAHVKESLEERWLRQDAVGALSYASSEALSGRRSAVV